MDDLLRQAAAALPPDVPQHLGVAVSGGSDSRALLLLLHRLSQARGYSLSAVTVDHGLRPESAAEAAAVGRFAAELQISHDTLVWSGWDGVGNTQNEARKARYALMSEWAASGGIPAIALGHTLDDQAETVVMRLARGAGVDGLAAMRAEVNREGLRWLRPLLGIRRETLRAFLRTNGISWHDDPSNADLRYDRIKVRDALEGLAPLGVTAEVLGQVARNMQSAGDALAIEAQKAARRIVTVQAGALKLEGPDFQALMPEIGRRIVIASLKWISGAHYAPRSKSVAAALAALRKDGSATLEGCRLLQKGDIIWIFREYNAVEGVTSAPDSLWDGRWLLSGPIPIPPDVRVAALGPAGLAECPQWRASGLPRDLLLASPAVWRDERLVAAPHAGHGAGWGAALQKGEMSYFHTLISH